MSDNDAVFAEILAGQRQSTEILLDIQANSASKADLRSHEQVDVDRFSVVDTKLDSLTKRVFYMVGAAAVSGLAVGGVISWIILKLN